MNISTMLNMSKLILSIIAMVTFGFGAKAQVKGQLDQLRELGEGTEFKAYWGIYKGDDGKFKGTPYKAMRVLKFENNMHNKLSGFSMKHKETGETAGYYAALPNHYTEPSVIYYDGQRRAWLYIDGLFYVLEGVKNPNSITNIKIEYILVREVAKDTEDAADKKKLTLKEKVAAAKKQLTEGESGPKEISERDHITIIKKYLADMKPIQEKATASFSSEIKQEIAEIEKADAEFLKLRQKQSKEYAARLNAQKGKSNGTSYKVKNISNIGIRIITDGGSTTMLNAGSTTNYTCSTDVYYCVGESSKGSLITVGENACGKTISIK